jgi:small basic protein
MWLPLLALILGLVIGLQFSFSIPQEYARYTAVGILGALDAVLGAVRAELNQAYDNRIFFTGLLSNVALAVALTYLGDRLGGNIDLSLAAVVAFGVRMFDNVAINRRHFL